MLNNVILIGRLTDNPTIHTLESGRTVSNIVLAVRRGYRNLQGEYDTDFINCTMWDANATNANEFCKKGSLIAIKGSIVQRDNTVYFTEDKELKKVIKTLEVFVERVTYLGF